MSICDSWMSKLYMLVVGHFLTLYVYESVLMPIFESVRFDFVLSQLFASTVFSLLPDGWVGILLMPFLAHLLVLLLLYMQSYWPVSGSSFGSFWLWFQYVPGFHTMIYVSHGFQTLIGYCISSLILGAFYTSIGLHRAMGVCVYYLLFVFPLINLLKSCYKTWFLSYAYQTIIVDFFLFFVSLSAGRNFFQYQFYIVAFLDNKIQL